MCVPKIMFRWCTVPEIWCATDGQTDEQMAGQEKWHIEVGAPPNKKPLHITQFKWKIPQTTEKPVNKSALNITWLVSLYHNSALKIIFKQTTNQLLKCYIYLKLIFNFHQMCYIQNLKRIKIFFYWFSHQAQFNQRRLGINLEKRWEELFPNTNWTIWCIFINKMNL